MIKMTKNIETATAVTHGGTFHADEVFATVILEKVFGDLTICRTFRIPEDLKGEVVVYRPQDMASLTITRKWKWST